MKKNLERGERGNAFEGYFLPLSLIQDEPLAVAAYAKNSKMYSMDCCS